MPRIRGASIGEHHEMVWAGLSAAMRELLLERDYDSITMGHIATAAGLARNTLYNYAADTKALTVELLSGAMRAGCDRIGRDPAALPATVRTAQRITLAALTSPAP